MVDYKSDAIKGWQRAYAATIDNAYGQVPSITFNEELIVVEAGSLVFRKDTGGIREEFTDASLAFPLLDSEDTVVGEASYGQVYMMLYSLYRHLATKRDVTAAEQGQNTSPADAGSPGIDQAVNDR